MKKLLVLLSSLAVFLHAEEPLPIELLLTPAAEQPLAPAAEQLLVSTADQPLTPAAEQPLVSTADQPLTPAAEQPLVSTADQPTTLAAEQPLVSTAEQSLSSATEQPLISEKAQKQFFGYFSLGSAGPLLLIISPEASLGLRKLCIHHAWDMQGGSSLAGNYVWGQFSYLYFFLPTNTTSYSSPYLGIGISGGYSRWAFNSHKKKMRGYANLPITIGLQWGKNQTNQFFQLQISPILITSLSYGVGF